MCRPEDTFARVRPHFGRIGITRVADITGLDRIGIPVYNAIMPRSRDVLSVYSGKGGTPEAARTSAVMEAVERYAAWLPLRPTTVASHDDLVAEGRAVIRPGELSIALRSQYRDDRPIWWVTGRDLVTGADVLVPHGAAVYGRDPGAPPCLRLTHTTGLASGNTLDEAVGHALREVIERDCMTISELVSSRLAARLPDRATQLRARNPHIDAATVPASAKTLLDRFAAAGLRVTLVYLDSDLRVPTIMASCAEDNGPSAAKAHGGFGTDPDPELALLRALTECAQGRAVDIQAMREDLALPDEDVPAHRAATRRAATIDRTGWAWRPAGRVVDFADLPRGPVTDLAGQTRFMLDRLAACGLDRAVAVDLSPPELPVHVARVIVPGLESWSVDRSKIGTRATRAWNEAAR
ncbi:YcaO-like family protein [Longispora fulva]|uniref:YcaO-like family protein n=1 Tax=Longispora fulva TaxID=619741 RepID=UPI0022777FE2|nr:YcaO-like family protein [Longispora fulva]